MKDFPVIAAAALVFASIVLVPSSPDVTAEIAIEASLDQFREVENDECENCNGTGKIGDGKIVSTCPVCRGTGKKTKSVLCDGEACEVK